MSDLNQREKDFEAKFALDEKIRFKVEARASKLFGLWAASKLGISDKEEYAIGIVEANLDIPGFEDVLLKINQDFKAKNIEMSEHLMQVELDKCIFEARRQIMTEG